MIHRVFIAMLPTPFIYVGLVVHLLNIYLHTPDLNYYPLCFHTHRTKALDGDWLEVNEILPFKFESKIMSRKIKERHGKKDFVEHARKQVFTLPHI